MILLARMVFRLLSITALLLLSACPQMTAPTGSPGAPLGATDSRDAGKNPDLLPEDPAPPAAAAPLPPPSGGSGGTGAGSPEFAARMYSPGEGGGVPTPGPIVADSRGGILGAPSASEDIETGEYRIRVVGWEGAGLPPWRNSKEFFEDVRNNRVTDEEARRAKMTYYVGGPLRRPGETEASYFERAGRTLDEFPLDPGFYLAFLAKPYGEVDASVVSAQSAAELKALVLEEDLDFVDERFVTPWKQRGLTTVPVPQGTFAPSLPPVTP